jgi:predicted outer membrane protein
MTTHRSLSIDAHGSRARRFGWFLGMLAVLLASVSVVLAAPSRARAYSGANGTSTGTSAGWTQTPYGPLGPADRDLIVRVRQAGLWEMPAGRMAQDRARSARVKEVGSHLEHDHLALDEQVRSVASQLGVALPDKPSVEQQGWLAELDGRRGADFDTTFANRLRAAHGKVFTAIAGVRAGTRNDMVRSFAETANNVVMKHMALLESIGLVDYAALPEPPAPVPAPAERLARSFGNGRGAPLVWIVLIAAIIACTSAAVRAVRPR